MKDSSVYFVPPFKLFYGRTDQLTATQTEQHIKAVSGTLVSSFRK